MAKFRVLIDSDVVINWLIKEKETSTHYNIEDFENDLETLKRLEQ